MVDLLRTKSEPDLLNTAFTNSGEFVELLGLRHASVDCEVRVLNDNLASPVVVLLLLKSGHLSDDVVPAREHGLEEVLLTESVDALDLACEIWLALFLGSVDLLGQHGRLSGSLLEVGVLEGVLHGGGRLFGVFIQVLLLGHVEASLGLPGSFVCDLGLDCNLVLIHKRESS